MGNSMSTQQVEKCWPTHWLPKPWALALHRKFALLYMQKFTSAFPDQETVHEWAEVWAEQLAGLTGDEIKYGFDLCQKQHEWPPTCAEFRACCKAAPKPYVALPPPTPIDREKGMKKVAEVLAQMKNRRINGPDYWRKVLATEGLPDLTYRVAKEALAVFERPTEEAA